MKHYISIFILGAMSALYSCSGDTEAVNLPPTVKTGECTATTRESATVEGTVLANGSHVDSYGIVYSNDAQMLVSPTYLECKEELSDKKFSTYITNIKSGQTFFYRTYVKSGGAYYYGDYGTFSTPTVSAPTFATLTVDEGSVEADEVPLSTSITDEGFGSDITYLSVTGTSFKYKKVADGTQGSTLSYSEDNSWSTAPATYDKSSKKFEGTLTGLASGTTYAVCAYASSAGYGTSNVVTFKTKTVSTEKPQVSAVSVTPNDASGLTINFTASVLSQGAGTVTNKGFVYSTKNTTPTINGNECTILDGGQTFSGGLENLSYSTTYYIRAYAENEHGVSYGEVYTYTTPDATYVPNIFTVTSKDVTSTSVTLVGVLNSNNVTIRTVGFQINGSAKHTQTFSADGTFSITVTGLNPETQYTFRAFCVDSSNKEYYGATETFTTSKATPSGSDIKFPE